MHRTTYAQRLIVVLKFSIFSLAVDLLVCVGGCPNLRAAEPTVVVAAQGVRQIVAHRGASAERPECTLSALRRAIEVGATAVEIDVRTSRGGKLFLLHDATLDRTTDGTGPANALTLAELQRLDAGSWFDAAYKDECIPSFVEAVETCRGQIDLLLDLKEQGDVYDRQVAQVIQQHGDPKRTIIGVRSVAQAKRFRTLLPASRQLALIPTVESIEAFAAAGVDTIRLWPRWLNEGDEPARRVREAGKQLHLNGSRGELAETLELLTFEPDSLSSDDPAQLKRTLLRIVQGDLPSRQLELLVEPSDTTRLVSGESQVKARSFLNRDYRMLELPVELVGLPRYAFNGGEGAHVRLRFRQAGVVFAAFEYNSTGNWSFADGRSPRDFGWQLWRKNVYRGSSNAEVAGNPHRADIWYRQFKPGQVLSGLPPWWLCLGIIDLSAAGEIDGFQPGLTSDVAPPQPRYSHAAVAAQPRPLVVPDFESNELFRQWQIQQRQRFAERFLYPYEGEATIAAGRVTEHDAYCRKEMVVALGGRQLFRFFRLEPLHSDLPDSLPTIVCFMGHGKVSQILEEEDSYQHACAAKFAEAGYLVYAMENIGMEPGPDNHLDLDQSLRLEGYGWYSLLFAHQRILLDQVFLDQHVDPRRVGVTGVSTGGLLALTAAVIEPRIAAASVQGIFGSMRISFIRDRQRHCSCGAIPGLLPEFDLPELALLVAPRQLHVANGATDGFSPEEAARCLELIRPRFEQAGGNRPHFTISPGGHEYALTPALEFFTNRMQAVSSRKTGGG